MLGKFAGTVKIVRSVKDSTLSGLNSKRRVFQRLTKILFVIFIGNSSNLLENVCMLSLTKEATDKDRYLKTELTISSKSCEEKISGKSECGEMRDFLRIQNRN